MNVDLMVKNWRDLIRPARIEVERDYSPTYGRFECAPLEASPSRTSPARIDLPVTIPLRSTTPTQKPARSYSPSGYMPGI